MSKQRSHQTGGQRKNEVAQTESPSIDWIRTAFEKVENWFRRKPTRKNLIVSTGDVSDIDGFMALAKYAQTGADVQFIMNYPAYLDVLVEETTYENEKPGLGFKYTAKEVIEREPDKEKCAKLFSNCRTANQINEQMKESLTELAWHMAVKVWQEAKPKGRLLFTVGGVNKINPFSKSAIKNEWLVYSGAVGDAATKISAQEGKSFGYDGNEVVVEYSDYEQIYVDFNGSMAFLNDFWLSKMLKHAKLGKIRAAFVMGGVLAYEAPLTMPSIAGTLNRFSCATMNQLYHPERTAVFFDFLKEHKIPTYVITNNVVSDLTTFADPEKKAKTLAGVHSFMEQNGIDGAGLKEFATAYYESPYNPPRKPFDFYTALALTEHLEQSSSLDRMSTEGFLFYCKTYGVTLVSGLDKPTWKEALADYDSRIDKEVKGGDVPFIKAKKENFAAEVKTLQTGPERPSLGVRVVKFTLKEDNTLVLGASESAAGAGGVSEQPGGANGLAAAAAAPAASAAASSVLSDAAMAVPATNAAAVTADKIAAAHTAVVPDVNLTAAKASAASLLSAAAPLAAMVAPASAGVAALPLSPAAGRTAAAAPLAVVAPHVKAASATAALAGTRNPGGDNACFFADKAAKTVLAGGKAPADAAAADHAATVHKASPDHVRAATADSMGDAAAAAGAPASVAAKEQNVLRQNGEKL